MTKSRDPEIQKSEDLGTFFDVRILLLDTLDYVHGARTLTKNTMTAYMIPDNPRIEVRNQKIIKAVNALEEAKRKLLSMVDDSRIS